MRTLIISCLILLSSPFKLDLNTNYTLPSENTTISYELLINQTQPIEYIIIDIESSIEEIPIVDVSTVMFLYILGKRQRCNFF